MVMIRPLLACILLLAVSVAGAQDFWQATDMPSDAYIPQIKPGPGNSLVAAAYSKGVYRSTDGGVHWMRFGITDTSIILGIATSQDGTIYASAYQGSGKYAVWRTTNNGGVWELLHTFDGIMTGLVVTSTGTLFASFSPGNIGHVYRSGDGGLTWRRTRSGMEVNYDVRCLAVDNRDRVYCAGISGIFYLDTPDTIWHASYPGDADFTTILPTSGSELFAGQATYSGIATSTDRGTSWSFIPESLWVDRLSMPLYCGAVSDDDIPCVGTNAGVYLRKPGSVVWDTLPRTFPSLSISALCFTADGFLLASPWAKGLYRSSASVTAVSDPSTDALSRIRLDQNYPNPFNPSTNIKYQIPSINLDFGNWNLGYVSLRVYDILGREVATLADGVMPAGEHTVRWDAGELPGGIYFYRVTAGGWSETKKMLLIR